MSESVRQYYNPEEDANKNLRKLIESEYQRYLELSEKLNSNLFNYTSRVVKENSGLFPETESALSNYVDAVSADPLSGAGNLVGLAVLWSDSQAQSRKTRAGTSLELQLEYVLRCEGITCFETQVRLEYPNGQTRVDFIFPSAQYYSESPSDCIAISCQTSSNDRFRLALSQVPRVQKYITTSIGSENLGANLQKLSTDKMDTVQTNGGKYVMFPEGKRNSQEMENHPAVVSYSELIDVLRNRQIGWIG